MQNGKDFWQELWQKIGTAPQTMGELAGKTLETAGQMAETSVQAMGNMANAAVQTAGQLGEKTVQAVGSGLSILGQTMQNTGKCMVDTEYREKVVYPWLRAVLRENWQKAGQECDESQDMLFTLWRYSHGEKISDKEMEKARAQMWDIVRVVPALAIFCLPGGAILLPLLARALPWDLMPSSFRKKVAKAYGDDALRGEFKAGEETPLDRAAQAPQATPDAQAPQATPDAQAPQAPPEAQDQKDCR